MQKIERYGVIALVVLLVTILAVSLWGESGWNWKFWEKKDASGEVANVDAQRPRLRQRLLQEQAKQEGVLPLQAPEPSAVQPIGTNGAPANPANPLVTPMSTVVTPGATPAPAPLGAANGQAQPVRPIATPIGGNTPAQPIGGVANAPRLESQPTTLAPVAPSGARTYVVKSGDTLGGIAARELGSSTRWTEIQALNGNLDPKKVRAGMTLNLPGAKSVATAAPASATTRKPVAGGRSYVVKNGDTLSKIAARELGNGERWTEIQELNPGLDPSKLKVGATLAMPAGATVAKADKQPSKVQDDAVGWSPRSGKKTAVQ